MPRSAPPKKQKGKEGDIPRRRAHTGTLNIQLLDFGTMEEQLKATEDQLRARVSRGLLPYRKWGGRIIFVASEIEEYFRRLPGVSVDEAIANTEKRHDGDGS